MLDLRLAVVDTDGKNPMLAFVDEEGEVVTRIGPIPKRANLVRQWLAEAYRCMDAENTPTPIVGALHTRDPGIPGATEPVGGSYAREGSDAPSVAG